MISGKQTKHSIGETIASLRKERGWTQAELADKLNVSDKAVSKWEQDGGTPNLETVPALANIFGVSIDYLLTGKEHVVDLHRIMTVENACKKDLPDVIENIDTKLLIDKDENGLTVFDYMLKYPCEKAVKAFFKRFPVDSIFARNNPLGDDRLKEVVRVLVEYKMTADLNKLQAFSRYLIPDDKKLGRAGGDVENALNLYTDEYFALILSGEKFKGSFRENYLGYFGSSQYENVIKYAINTKNDAMFKEIWKHVKKINDAYCALVKKTGNSSRRDLNPYNYENGKLIKTEYFLVDLGEKFLGWMLDCGYIEEAKSYQKIPYTFYAKLKFPEDRIRLAELKRQGKGNTYEAVRLSVMEDGLLCLDKFSQIDDYKIAKRLINEECIHKFELFCELLDEERYDELSDIVGEDEDLEELLEDPEDNYDDIKSVGFSKFIRHWWTDDQGRDEWPRHWFEIEIKGAKEYNKTIEGEEDSALEYIQEVKEDYFKSIWGEHERQLLRKKLAKKYPRTYFTELLDKGDTEIAVIKLCVLLEGLLKTGYDYEGDLADLINQYCYDYDVDDETYDLLNTLRILRNSYVHPILENVDLTKKEILQCMEIVFKIAK